MADLTTNYMGLVLKNPIIIGSSGLTSTVEKIKELEANGAAAVVLKSIFEEEILRDVKAHLDSAKSDKLIYTDYSETLDYIDLHFREESVNNYLNLIKGAKSNVLIPVIASINCLSDSEWFSFAKKIEGAGADGLELNIFLNPSDNSNLNFEETYKTIITSVLAVVKIPVSVKFSQYFTKPNLFLTEISKTGIKGMVLFNRFYQPDIDIEKLSLKEAEIFSTPEESNQVLRWIGILSGKVPCSLAASTGVSDSTIMIKQILAGADAVQIVSAVYKNGPQYITKMLEELENWMDRKGFSSLSRFKASVNMNQSKNPSVYERMQFMKYFGGY